MNRTLEKQVPVQGRIGQCKPTRRRQWPAAICLVATWLLGTIVFEQMESVDGSADQQFQYARSGAAEEAVASNQIVTLDSNYRLAQVRAES